MSALYVGEQQYSELSAQNELPLPDLWIRRKGLYIKFHYTQKTIK